MVSFVSGFLESFSLPEDLRVTVGLCWFAHRIGEIFHLLPLKDPKSSKLSLLIHSTVIRATNESEDKENNREVLGCRPAAETLRGWYKALIVDPQHLRPTLK